MSDRRALTLTEPCISSLEEHQVNVWHREVEHHIQAMNCIDLTGATVARRRVFNGLFQLFRCGEHEHTQRIKIHTFCMFVFVLGKNANDLPKESSDWRN